jgi:MarR family transcriptional regulator, organic hydroperoxide resistance regulator
MRYEQTAHEISRTYARIYYLCHPHYTLNLPHQAVRALQFIDAGLGPTVKGLARHLGVAHNTASEQVTRLVDRALVEKRRPVEDERSVELHLTSVGRQALDEQTGLDEARLQAVFTQMTEPDRQAVAQGLATLLRHLEAHP